MVTPLATRETAKLRKRLEALQASVVDRKRRVDSDLNRESGAIPADFSEQASAVENDEALVAIQNELAIQLEQITHALQRLENGNYGVCESCKQAISEARLDVMPFANVCFQCANKGHA